MIRISEKHWTRFKQELPAILYLSGMQIWHNFNFPFLIWTGFWGQTIASVLGIALCTLLFVNAREWFVPFFDEWFIDEVPDKKLRFKFKITHRIIIGFFIALEWWYMWYKNWWNVSTSHFVAITLHNFILYWLWKKAAQRQRKQL